MPDPALWTIDELAEQVADTLRGGSAARPNGRVREVPDRRTIRWYTTIGLLDRPAAMRGRTALYSRRHLLQLLAVKRLQGRGRSLAQVQSELLGATDATLAAIARQDIGADATEAADADPVARDVALPSPSRTAGRAERFWAASATASTAEEVGAPDGAAPSQAKRAVAAEAPAAAAVPAVRLGSGVVLLLDAAAHAPDTDDLAAIAQAAAPLLELLRTRGLDEPNHRRGHR